MQTHWRLAFMFDAAGGNLAELANELRQAQARIRSAIGGNAVRLGVASRTEVAGDDADVPGTEGWRTVDGAIEVTIPNGAEAGIPGIAAALRPILGEFAKPGSLEVMTGAMFHMVPVRGGEAFLSLAFRRDPGTTVAQFRDWWLNQHSKVAIPVLGSGLLAYDQVHVDTAASRAAADALGVPYFDYDAYDNLTWTDERGFLDSINDPEGMARIAADEVGRIDNSTRRHALMNEVD